MPSSLCETQDNPTTLEIGSIDIGKGETRRLILVRFDPVSTGVAGAVSALEDTADPGRDPRQDLRRPAVRKFV